MIFIVYTGIQGLELLLIMFSSMVLCNKPSFADQPDEGPWFCDIGCCSLPTGMLNLLFDGNKHGWKWALFNTYPIGSYCTNLEPKSWKSWSFYVAL